MRDMRKCATNIDDLAGGAHLQRRSREPCNHQHGRVKWRRECRMLSAATHRKKRPHDARRAPDAQRRALGDKRLESEGTALCVAKEVDALLWPSDADEIAEEAREGGDRAPGVRARNHS